MNDSMKLAAMSVLRSVLIAAGGAAVAKGWISEGMLEQGVGAFVVLATLVWGAIDKLRKPS